MIEVDRSALDQSILPKEFYNGGLRFLLSAWWKVQTRCIASDLWSWLCQFVDDRKGIALFIPNSIHDTIVFQDYIQAYFSLGKAVPFIYKE